MVLADSTSDATFAPDALPPTDVDSYDAVSTSSDPSKLFIGNDAESNPVVIDLDRLPQIFSPFAKRTQYAESSKAIIQDSCRFAATIMERPVRQEEADALAQVYTSTLRTASYGTPAGVAVATVLATRGNKEFRFPFWKPMREGSKFSPDVFGPLKGPRARAAWVTARFGAYWFLGALIGQSIAGAYALSSSLARRAMDPRLREFNAKLNEQIRSGQAKKTFQKARADPRPTDEEPGPRGTETWEQAQQRRRVQDLSKRYEEDPTSSPRSRQPPRVVDDASPTGGMFAEELWSDEQVASRSAQQSNSPVGQQQPRSTNQGAQSSSQDSTSSSGSAWERLRQGAMSDNAKASSKSSSSRS